MFGRIVHLISFDKYPVQLGVAETKLLNVLLIIICLQLYKLESTAQFSSLVHSQHEKYRMNPISYNNLAPSEAKEM